MSGVIANLIQAIEAKTADYYMKASDIGKIFTNRGATGAVNLTLPDTAQIAAGWFVEFFVVANQSLTITAYTADTMVAFNDAAADSVAFSTSNEKIGGGGKVMWDGTGWLVFINLGMDSQTPVIAT